MKRRKRSTEEISSNVQAPNFNTKPDAPSFVFCFLEFVISFPCFPLIQSFFDQTSGLKNTEITPGGMGLLKGSDLTFDTADAAQGIFFIDEAGAETKVSKLLETLASKISFRKGYWKNTREK